MLLTSCGTTSTVASRRLPPFEPPIAQSDRQLVRTTAYTHTEDDHVTYGARNALGGTLQSAIARLELATPRDLPVVDLDSSDNITIALMTREKQVALAKQRAKEKKSAKNSKKAKGRKVAKVHKPQPRIGSAAADWSRWPAGTVFRVVETGEVFQVDDYGKALAGTNTIDLYKPTRAEMNKWGVRHVTIENIIWGDVDKSLAILRGRSKYAHVRKMIAGIEDRYQELKRPANASMIAQATPSRPVGR